MTCSEKNFIVRLKKQKEDALEYIIDSYMPLVKAIAWKILQPLGKNDVIDECISDVFISVWQRANQFEGDVEDFKRWIGMVAKYKAIDIYRIIEKQRVREQSIEMAEVVPAERDTQKIVLLREEKNELLLTINNLEPIDRDIFLMKYYLDMTNNEIAESLNMTKAAVDNRLYRGKKKLSTTIRLEERYI